MSLIDDIRKDREAGTPGEWSLENRGPISIRVITAKDGQVELADAWSKDGDSGLDDLGADANARRIARVPDMEAALLAMTEAFTEAEYAMAELGDPETALSVLERAWKEATS